MSSQLQAETLVGFQVYFVLSYPVLFVLFDSQNLICVEDAFPFINKYPDVCSHSGPRSPLKSLHVTCHKLKP